MFVSLPLSITRRLSLPYSKNKLSSFLLCPTPLLAVSAVNKNGFNAKQSKSELFRHKQKLGNFNSREQGERSRHRHAGCRRRGDIGMQAPPAFGNADSKGTLQPAERMMLNQLTGLFQERECSFQSRVERPSLCPEELLSMDKML